MPVIPTTPTPPDPDLQMLVAQAREDLAGRISLPVDEIEVLGAEAVIWPDSSLGSPQPGMRYKQVPTDGALIRLQAMGRVYEYHRGESRGLFLCERSSGALKDAPPRVDVRPEPPAD